MSAERLDPPESPSLSDFDTLGDRQYDDAVEEALWKPRLLRARCEWCATKGCVSCAGNGYIVVESSHAR